MTAKKTNAKAVTGESPIDAVLRRTPGLRLGSTIHARVAPGRILRHPVTGVPMSASVATELKVDGRTLACLRDGDLIIQT